MTHVVGEYDKNEIPKEKTIPKITSSDAFLLAKDAFISAEKILGKDQVDLINNELSGFYDEGIRAPHLVYFRPDKKMSLKLCYRVDILSEILKRFYTIYIDCSNGNIIKIADHKANNIATIETVYNGPQTVQVEWRGWPSSYYYLRDDQYATPIETRNSSIRYYSTCTPWGFGNLDYVYKGDLNWPVDFKMNAASSHWAVEQAYKVFKNNYGRTYGTFKTAGGEIRMENNYNKEPPFYFYGGSYDYIHVGNTIGTAGFEGTLDAIAHEFTHGVMYRSRGVDGLAYDEVETGELMESFSDIFAVMVEYFSTGSTDYIVGTNLLDIFKRSIQSPRDYLGIEPILYLDQNCTYQILSYTQRHVPLYWHQPNIWVNPGPGIDRELPGHINNSVQNYWFYLLANGGSQLGITVNGIGLYDASKIAYRNMVYDFSIGSTFDDMRQASIVNAATLYGECSNQYTQVMNAWAAVGVGEAANPCLHTEIYGNEFIWCGETSYYSANIYGGSGNYSYLWYVDYEPYSNESSINLTYYPEYDMEQHYISLEVTDGNLFDTDDQSIYVYSCSGGGNLRTNEVLKFKVFPNPATSSTKIEFEEDLPNDFKQYTIKIVDRNGKVVYSNRSYDKEITINTSTFQKGIYSTIVNTDNKYGSAKLIVK